ncbi:hypothetical protein LguiA_001566 [Lonicera macranthoides]
MDRNREGRRPNIAVSNGVSRRRHRSNSLRDSPDENGPVELPEHSRLRDRGGLKKDRDRERERSSRSKRRRGSNREEGGDDTSEEEEEEETTVNEEDDEVYDVLPPNHQHRKMSRNFRTGPAADEMIGVSVPRKARSASTKRMHDWISAGGGGGGGGVGGDPIHRQESASPEESASSFRKKMANNGSTKPRPHHPKSCTKPVSSSSNPEELEIEIAEVLYGLSHASNNDTAKNDSREVNKSSSDAKSRVSSPTPNTPSSIVVPQPSSLLPQNSSTVAPKRKRPRQVVENLGNLSSTKMKVEVEINQQHLNNEISSLNLDKNSAENVLPKEMKLESVLSANISTEEEVRDVRFVASTKKEVTSSKESSPVGLVADREDAAATATTVGVKVMDIESQREGKYQIDLNSDTDYTAPPPQLRSSPNREGVINFAAASDSNLMVSSNVDAELADKEDKKVEKIGNGEAVNVGAEEKAKVTMEEADSHRPVVNKESDNGNKLQHEVPKPQLQAPTKLAKDEPNTEKTAQPNAFPLPMSVASWPGGLPPMGYMAPLQGLVSMDGSTMSSTPIQPLFSQPRGKRCATHYNIAKNIQYIQQLMKMNPFWPAAAGSAPLFGAKPCNFNVMPPAEFNGNITGRSISSVQDKGQGSTIFPGNSEKDKGSHADQRKQPIVLQQTLPPVAPNNILHGPTFIFPFNQQQTAVAAASAKSPTIPGNLASSASNSATVTASSTAATTATTMSFNFPNMPVNEAQYLAILQNNAYSFPIPAVGAPPNYRGAHPQAMPLLNGSFYPSQMIHPQQMQPAHQNTNTSSGSSSSQKHLQGLQQRPQGSSVNGGSGNFHNFPAPKNRPSQQQNQQHINPPPARQLENETGGEDSPSTADSRVSQSRPPMSVYYGQNFSMSIHPQSIAAGLPGARTSSTGSGNQNEKKHQQPQTFAMSFAPMNGSGTASGIDITSQLAQNHAIIHLPEATRQSYQIMAAAVAAQAAQHKKHFGVSDEGKAGGGDVTNVDEERKGSTVKSQPNAGQSIAFSRSELADASVSGVGASGSFSVSNSHLSPLYQHQQQQINQVQNQKLDQQQVIKLHKLQQHHDQQRLARSKTPATSNGGAYPQHLTSVSVAENFQNILANFPQCYKQKSNSNSSSPSQSPQWKNTAKTPTPQGPSSLSSSTTSSLKNHTQISFGSTQKPSQPPNNNPSPSPVVVGSPTRSSISKGSTASPRSITASTSNKIGQVSTLSPQQAKNPPSVPNQKPSILGNPPITSSSSSMATKSQMQQQQQQQQQQTQQFSKQAMQQTQLFFSNHYMQPPQAPNTTSSTVSASSGYYLQRKRPEQLQQPLGSSGSGTSDPAKAVAAGTSFATNTKSGNINSQYGLQSSGNMQLPPGFYNVNAVPAAVQAKPAEQKQPAGEHSKD